MPRSSQKPIRSAYRPWLLIGSHLPTKPEIHQLSKLLDRPTPTIVGLLVLFWIWVDAYFGGQPCARGDLDHIDALVDCPGFADALEKVGWLTHTNEGMLFIPGFDRYLSRKSKTRAMTARRVERYRKNQHNAPCVTNDVSTNHSNNMGEKVEEQETRPGRSQNALRIFNVHFLNKFRTPYKPQKNDPDFFGCTVSVR